MDSLDNKSRQKLPSSQKFRTRQDIVEWGLKFDQTELNYVSQGKIS